MTLAGRLTARIPPDAGVTNAAHRALLAASLPRLRGRDDRASRALARALRTTALGRFSPEERAWIARIEARRLRLADEHGLWSPARSWSMPRIWSRFLLRLVGELRPRSCMELGAGFGISGLYQGAALELSDSGRLTTLDREQSLIPIARQGYAELGLDRRIELITGPIGQTLAGVADREAPIDYALIDAEHTEAATVENFDVLKPRLSAGAVVVVDDILSTEEMRRAWTTIRSRPGISLALTLRRVGIVLVPERS